MNTQSGPFVLMPPPPSAAGSPAVTNEDLPQLSEPAVFHDPTGRRRKTMLKVGYAAGAGCAMYLGLFAASLTGGPFTPKSFSASTVPDRIERVQDSELSQASGARSAPSAKAGGRALGLSADLGDAAPSSAAPPSSTPRTSGTALPSGAPLPPAATLPSRVPFPSTLPLPSGGASSPQPGAVQAPAPEARALPQAPADAVPPPAPASARRTRQ